MPSTSIARRHETRPEVIEAMPRRLIRRRPVSTVNPEYFLPANRCAMVINGERVLVDINVKQVPPDVRAVVITNDGEMRIEACDPCTDSYKTYGERQAWGQWRPSPHGGRCREAVIVIGAVIESETTSEFFDGDVVQ